MTTPSPAPSSPSPRDPSLVAPADDTGRLLRPYAITGGRTDAPSFLNLESQLRRTERTNVASTQRWEAARIVEMADRPIAVIEVAARVGLPVGVAKVVIGDLIDQGVLTLGYRPPDSSFASVLQRVLDGLDRL